MVFAEHEPRVQPLPAEGTDQSLHGGVLPRAPRSRNPFLDLQSRYSLAKLFAVERIPISQQEAGSGLVRKRLNQLLRRPGSRRMLRHVEVQNATPVVGQHNQDLQHTKSRGRDGEEINRDQFGRWLPRNERQVCEGGFLFLGIRLETVLSETPIPSLSNSP